VSAVSVGGMENSLSLFLNEITHVSSWCTALICCSFHCCAHLFKAKPPRPLLGTLFKGEMLLAIFAITVTAHKSYPIAGPSFEIMLMFVAIQRVRERL